MSLNGGAVDLIETGISGHFVGAPSIIRGREVVVSGTFEAGFCDGTRWSPDGT
jgi:hypothetical protein